MQPLKHKVLPFVMWLLPLSFFSYQFILRLWPGLMVVQIMERLSINASSFGILAAFYYYGYAGIQIPIAILLDKFGARYIIFISAILCGIFTLIFTYTTNFYIAAFSRFWVGIGSAVGLLGTSKVIAEWFPRDWYTRMIGFSFTLGFVGAIYGGKPISLLIKTYGGQKVSLILGVIALIIGCVTYFFLRTPKKNVHVTLINEPFKILNFKAIMTSPLIWCLATANLLMVGMLEGFADVWGIQYLIKAYHLEKSNAAGFISFIFLGMLCGGPLLALCSKKLGNYIVIGICGLGTTLAFIFLLTNTAYNPLLLSCLFFLLGIMGCYQAIVFAAGAELVSPKFLGMTIAFLNCINMLGGSFFHTIIGKIMDLFWSGSVTTDGTTRIYDLYAYKCAISTIPFCAFLGTILVCGCFFLNKKHTK